MIRVRYRIIFVTRRKRSNASCQWPVWDTTTSNPCENIGNYRKLISVQSPNIVWRAFGVILTRIVIEHAWLQAVLGTYDGLDNFDEDGVVIIGKSGKFAPPAKRHVLARFRTLRRSDESKFVGLSRQLQRVRNVPTTWPAIAHIIYNRRRIPV